MGKAILILAVLGVVLIAGLFAALPAGVAVLMTLALLGVFFVAAVGTIFWMGVFAAGKNIATEIKEE